MTVCFLCGKEELGFICPYCNSSFCAEHRLPEAHGCPGLALLREKTHRRVVGSFKSRDNQITEKRIEQPWYSDRPTIRITMRRRARFSRDEIRDLLIAMMLVVLVSISVMGGSTFGIINGFRLLILFAEAGYAWFPFSIIAVFLISFIVHEMAHKFVAQRDGLWSEFRMLPQGYLLSLIAILLSIPVFGTGAVFTATDPGAPQKFAKSTLAGPVSNLLLGISAMSIGVLLALTRLGATFHYQILLYAAALNGMLGLFNLIPVRPLDGWTVFVWNKQVWMIVVLSLLVVTGWGYLQIL